MIERARTPAELLRTEAFTLRGVSLERPGVGRVLDRIDLRVPAGRITALVGPSGSGKTSLLRLLNRLEEPTAGEILYRGRALGEYPVRELRRRVGFVFQAPVLFPGTVGENLRIAAELAGLTPSEWETTLGDALQAAELEPVLLDRPAERLSGGEAQRLTIARALVASPDVLLLDEPTSALDPGTAQKLVQTIHRAARERGLTVAMVTHRHGEALQVSDEIVVLTQGRIVNDGLAESVRARPAADRPNVDRAEE